MTNGRKKIPQQTSGCIQVLKEVLICYKEDFISSKAHVIQYHLFMFPWSSGISYDLSGLYKGHIYPVFVFVGGTIPPGCGDTASDVYLTSTMD